MPTREGWATILPKAEEWMRAGRCVNLPTSMFFPERAPGAAEVISAAKEVCRECSVRIDCLEYALRNHERDGIWGGLSAKERRRKERLRAVFGED